MPTTQQIVDSINAEPASQAGARALRAKGEDPDPSGLYLVELALWGLKRLRLTGTWAKFKDLMQLTLLEVAPDRRPRYEFPAGSPSITNRRRSLGNCGRTWSCGH